MSQESNNLVEENELKQAELAEIDQQREQRPGYSKPDLITGLAISGGGIRSGTFALGVLQALRELKLLRTIDYLSTVSGGGFIGSWLVANRYHGAEAEQKAEAELNKIEGEFKKSEIALNRAKNVLKFQAAHKAKAKVSAMAGLKPRNARRVQAAVKARASLKALALYKAKTKLYALSLHKAKTKLNTLVALKTQNARRVQAAVKTRFFGEWRVIRRLV